MADTIARAIAVNSALPHYSHTYAAIGDSITLSSSVISDTNTELQDNWFHRALWMVGGKYIKNAGVNGNTTSQMLARIDADIIALNPRPSACFIAGGTNDITAIGSNPISLIVSNVETMIRKLISAGILPILLTILPRSTPETYQGYIVTLNQAYFKLATKYEIPFIDTYTNMVTVSDGTMISAYTSDGLHPTAAGGGYSVMAQSVYDQFLSKIPLPNAINIASQTAYNKNMLVNGLFLNDTNSDGTPDNWTLSGTGTCEIVTDTNIKGNWAKLTATSSAAATLLSANISTGWSVGDTINLSGLFKAADIKSAGATFYVYVAFNGAASVLVTPCKLWYNDITLGRFNLDFKVPTGCTSFNIRAWISAGGTGGGNVSIAQMGFINMTTLGI
jgi:lysophospholipase L1-like esterase